ncbi:DUF3703 domain-containing protein [Flavobacterium sp. TBRC 19031]|uniref:DUF3703 domain-containing protein n=1 Tax=Flavobacterium mekongense TaxID=3379707 RepID=UPI0039997A08
MHFVGKVPTGNLGGSNVHPLKPFPIEKELLDILNKAEKRIILINTLLFKPHKNYLTLGILKL